METQPIESETAPQTPAPVTFEEIIQNPELLDGIKRLGFSTPTPVQALAIPAALTGRDLIVQAKTGSGKTFAYALPLLSKALATQSQPRQPFALVIVPTRELANQVIDVINSLSSALRPVSIIGGADFDKQVDNLDKDSRVVIGTPGRLLDLIRQKKLRLNNCRYFVLDEADEMLSTGFLEDIRTLLSRLPDKRQGLFVSATISPRVEMLANSFLTKHEIVFVDSVTDLPPVIHYYADIAGDVMAKPNALCDIIEALRPANAIIFCNTKSDTQLVEALLRRRGFDARRLNSDLSQSQRERVMKRIRDRDLQFLVATDIAARGLDIEQLDMVINYTVHEQPELYVHRTGRTGRAGKSGRAVSLIGPRDFGSFHFLKKVLEIEFQKLNVPTDEDIAEARLPHVFEMLRQSNIEVGKRDILVAEKLMKEFGAQSETSEELQEFVAKLCRHLVEHHVSQEAKSLDEELEARAVQSEEESENDERRERRGRDRDNRRGEQRDDRRSDRRGDRRRDRRANQSEDRRERRDDDSTENLRNRPEHTEVESERQDADGNSQEDSRGISGERRERGERGRGRDRGRRADRSGDRGQGRNDRPNTRDSVQGGESALSPDVNKIRELRLFIGQGSAHGMTADTFKELATEFAEIADYELKNLIVREHHGYVDVEESFAKRLIDNLNGIEYNGQVLPVEIATVILPPKRDGGRRDGRGGHGRGRRRDDRDRRGGRNGGGGRDRRDRDDWY